MKSIFVAIAILLSTTLAHAQSNDDRYFASWGNKKVTAVTHTKKIKAKRHREYVEPRHYTRVERRQRRYAGESYAPDPVQWVAKSIARVASTVLGGRPEGCPARAWCGCWLGQHVGKPDRSLWLARNWASIGSNAGGPQVGAIVVWPHHVGKITAVEGNRIKVLSGNDGRAVKDRWRTTVGVIAYRRLS